MNTIALPAIPSAVTAIILFAAACRPSTPPEEAEASPPAPSPPSPAELEQVRETGNAVAKSLMQSLGGQLKAALESGGPVPAIHVCRQAAMPLTTAAAANFEGVVTSVRRTTLKPRNPANAPGDLDRAVLERMSDEMTRTGDPPAPAIEWLEDSARYYQPLVVQPLCLKCHGDPSTFPTELVSTLKESYPADQATGYQLGDLRGVVCVEITRP